MNGGYSKSSGPDWCSVVRIPTQTTWTTVDAEKAKQQQSQRKERVKIIVSKDTKSPKTQ